MKRFWSRLSEPLCRHLGRSVQREQQRRLWLYKKQSIISERVAQNKSRSLAAAGCSLHFTSPTRTCQIREIPESQFRRS